MNQRFPLRPRAGFSFTEAIFTIAIIGIMSSIVMTAMSNLSKDANRILVRQQQAAINSALNGWVMSQLRVTSGTNAGQMRGIDSVRTDYNAQATTKARFYLLVPDANLSNPDERAGFLDQATADHFLEFSVSSDRLKSQALNNLKQHFTLPAWQQGEAPEVLLEND